MNKRIVPGICFSLVVVFVFTAGCSKQWLQRFAYDVGTQRSCLNANENRPNESMKDLECMTPTSEKNREYDEYQRAREEELTN